MHTMNLVYFAMVSDQLGKRGETLELPDTVQTVDALLAHLRTLGAPYQTALQNPKRIRVAVNQQMAMPETSIVGAKEVAIFPPVTGG